MGSLMWLSMAVFAVGAIAFVALALVWVYLISDNEKRRMKR